MYSYERVRIVTMIVRSGYPLPRTVTATLVALPGMWPDLLKGMPLKDTAHLLGVSWDAIKEIHTHHLECHYAPPSLEGVDSIDIDEFAV